MHEDNPISLGKRRTIAALPAAQRSAVTNNRRQFVDGDGRSEWARRHRDLVELHCSDLGGAEGMSEAQLSLVRRISTLECELERLDGRLSRGEEISLAEYTTTANALRRLIETVGLKRVARAINGRELTLEEIARHINAQPREDE